MGRKSKPQTSPRKKDAAVRSSLNGPDVLGLTILPGVELPEWAHSTRPAPAWGAADGVGAFAGTPGFAQPIDAPEAFAYPVDTTFTEFAQAPFPTAPVPAAPVPAPSVPNAPADAMPGSHQGWAALAVPGAVDVPAQRGTDVPGHPLAPAAAPVPAMAMGATPMNPDLSAMGLAGGGFAGAGMAGAGLAGFGSPIAEPLTAPSPFGAFVPLGDPAPMPQQMPTAFTAPAPAMPAQMPAQIPAQIPAQMPAQMMPAAPQMFAPQPAVQAAPAQARPSFSQMGMPAPAAYGAPAGYGMPAGYGTPGEYAAPAGYPAPAGYVTPEDDQTTSAGRGVHGAAPSGLKRLGIIGAVAALVAGLGAAGVMLLGGSDAESTPETASGPANLAMPAAVGGLTANDTPPGAAFLNQTLGVPVRNTGLSIARAYSPAPGSPATTAAAISGIAGTPAMMESMRVAFAQRTGARLGAPSVVGETTCWAVPKTAKVPAGSLCAWSDPTSVGRVFVLGQNPASAGAVAGTVKAAVRA